MKPKETKQRIYTFEWSIYPKLYYKRRKCHWSEIVSCTPFNIWYICFVDYAGDISSICSATNETGNDYIDIKLKTKTDEYKIMQTIRSHNPTNKGCYLDTLQSSSIPLKVSKPFDTNNGIHFFYTFRSSKIETGISLNFKSNSKLELSINSRGKMGT